MGTRTSAFTVVFCLAMLPFLSCVSAQEMEVQKLAEQMKKFKGELIEPSENNPWFELTFKRRLTPADLAQLRPILLETRLPVGLHLDAKKWTDADFAPLKDLVCLRSLHIESKMMTDAGVAHLSGLTNLQHLGFGNEGITDAGLAHISGLKKLRTLWVDYNDLTPACFSHLAEMSEMEDFTILGQWIGDAHLRHMKRMTKLKRLSVDVSELTDAGMAQIAGFTALRELRFQGHFRKFGKRNDSITRTGLDGLQALKKLEKLSFESCDALRGDGLAFLASLPKLRHLSIDMHRQNMMMRRMLPPPGKIKALAKEHKLGGQEGRFIGRCLALESLQLNGDVGDDAIAGIKNLLSLRELDLSDSNVGDAGMAHLSQLKSLRQLDISNTLVSGDGLKSLRDLTALEDLKIDMRFSKGNNIADDALASFAGLTKLKNLNLSCCEIAGPGLKHLLLLTKLEYLNLEGNPLKDEGLAHLQPLANLRDLNLQGTLVEDDALPALKKSLPGARIIDAFGEELLSLEARRKKEDLTNTPASFTLTAREYYKEYRDDFRAAMEKYRNKVVELSGEADGFGYANHEREPWLSLDTRTEKQVRDNSLSTNAAICFTMDAQPWARLAPGQKIVLKGRQTRLNTPYPLLFDCVILKASEDTAIVLTVEQLSGELAANRIATDQKYAGKAVRLTGILNVKKRTTLGGVDLILKNAGRFSVTGDVLFGARLTQPFKEGDPITVYGRYRHDVTGIHLEHCLPIRK